MSQDATGPAKTGHYRWIICGLLLATTTINYLDRQVFGILAPSLQHSFGWTAIDYSHIVMAFEISYAVGLLVVGRLVDWLGTRWGFCVILLVWSGAAMAHALAASVLGFAAARAALAFGESGNFPAAIKTVAEWFPKKERALATGIFNAGSNVGAILAPLAVPWIAIHYGWQWAFLITGALGLAWLVVWLVFYRAPEKQPRLSAGELSYIRSGPPESAARPSLLWLLGRRQTWAFIVGKSLTDPIWWFFLFWLPMFFSRNYGLTLDRLGPPLICVYLSADAGSIAGGAISSRLIRSGHSINCSRKVAMLLCALCATPVAFVSHATHLWTATAIVSLACAAHQGFSANLLTLTSDMFPRTMVGSVVGIGGMAGTLCGSAVAYEVGHLLANTGSYTPIFIVAGSGYLLASLAIHGFAPRLEPVSSDLAPSHS